MADTAGSPESKAVTVLEAPDMSNPALAGPAVDTSRRNSAEAKPQARRDESVPPLPVELTDHRLGWQRPAEW